MPQPHDTIAEVIHLLTEGSKIKDHRRIEKAYEMLGRIVHGNNSANFRDHLERMFVTATGVR